MKNKQFVIVVASITIAIISIAWAILMTTIATDLRDKAIILEQENIDLKWQLEQVDQMVCRED